MPRGAPSPRRSASASPARPPSRWPSPPSSPGGCRRATSRSAEPGRRRRDVPSGSSAEPCRRLRTGGGPEPGKRAGPPGVRRTANVAFCGTGGEDSGQSQRRLHVSEATVSQLHPEESRRRRRLGPEVRLRGGPGRPLRQRRPEDAGDRPQLSQRQGGQAPGLRPQARPGRGGLRRPRRQWSPEARRRDHRRRRARRDPHRAGRHPPVRGRRQQLDYLAFGPHHEGDGDLVKDWWTD